ncbi:molybdopterin molybdotransferase MoeA [Streptomyces oceani]|uniref:Molybdopterin molybdenumtransferase n=1 Tax=Streptomyces oceani TaxID=1075402 RepID=A0A1E7JWX2_9ACTN|nr:molybdopterin molybdotransferase MoeA [Streptomyces oceani]OEU96132.1 hypothetical protein AN216_22635 [Streptomyces oceani]
MSDPDEFDEAMAVANGTPTYRPQPRPSEGVEDDLLPDWLSTGRTADRASRPSHTSRPSRSAGRSGGTGAAAPSRPGRAEAGRAERSERGGTQRDGARHAGPAAVDPWEAISRTDGKAPGFASPAGGKPDAGAAAPKDTELTRDEEGPADPHGERRAGPAPAPDAPPVASDPAAGTAAASAPATGGAEGRTDGPARPPAVSWSEARARAARAARPARPGTLPLDSALDHVLAEPVVATTDLPAFDSSAMDGWAVSGPGPWQILSADTPADTPADPPHVAAPHVQAPHADSPRAQVAGAGLLAGDPPAADLPDGHALRIATGARVPHGATAVLRSERSRVRGERLHLGPDAPTGSAAHGADVRPRGQECRSGDQLVAAGTPVTPAVLGLAAAAGHDELTVLPRPRAEVLVLGAELLRRGRPREGMVRDALGPMVGPWLTSLGAEVLVTRRLGDDVEALHEAVATSTADLLVTTGGTAAGPVDHVRPTLDRLGARLLVDGVAVRPGHPMLLAELPPAPAPTGGGSSRESRYLIGLPGNPLAAVAGLVTLAGPLVRTLAGHPAALADRADGPDRPVHLDGPDHPDRRAHPDHLSGARPWTHFAVRERAALTAAQRGHPRDTQLVPVHRPGGAGTEASPVPYTGPAMLRGIAAATHLAVVPPGGLPAGTAAELLDLP